jgi:hypothetical protein
MLLTICRGNMCAIHRTVKQLHNLRVDVRSLHLESTKQFIPFVESGLTDLIEVKVWDLGLGIRACLVRGDERHADSDKDRGCAYGAVQTGTTYA